MNFKDFIKLVIRIMEESNIDYVIVGGLAAIYYGEPRATQDIDIIVKISPSESNRVKAFCDLLKKSGLNLIGNWKSFVDALKARTHISIFDPDHTFRIDLQGVYSRLNILAFNGRRRVKIFGIETWLQGPEDLIIAKLSYYIGNRDLRDVVSILQYSYDQIDFNRLWKLAKEYSVEEKLRKILDLLKR